MKKRRYILLAVVAFCVPLHTSAQTYIKANALYWAALLPNVSVETRLGGRFTFNADVTASLWSEVGDRPYMGGQLIFEGRYYTKEAFKGFYMGIYAASDWFKMSKWDHPATDIHNGIGMSFGATVGYQIAIAKRWNMDFYVGGGWHHGWYYATHRDTGEILVPKWDKSGEWIPYKIGVTFGYRLSRK